MDIPGARELEAVGLYDPAAPDAAERLALLTWLAENGASIDQMLMSASMGSLQAAAGDAAIRPGPRLTIEELSERSGLTVGEIEAVLLAAGTPPPAGSEGAAGFVESDIETFVMFRLGSELFGTEPTLQFTRVLGTSMARIAEAALSLFQVNVEAELAERSAGKLALAQANLEAVQSLGLIPAAMAGLFRLHVEHAVRRSRHATYRPDAYGSRRLTVGFVDLVGFTPLTQRLDERSLAALVEDFEARANRLVTQHDGRVVKHIGDEVMFVAVSPAAACRIALGLVEAFRDGGGAVQPHGGLALGGLLTRGGDYYGPIVNLASRVADIAVPDEVLVTEEVQAEAASDPDLVFEPAGRRLLKGFDEPVALWSLTRSRPTP